MSQKGTQIHVFLCVLTFFLHFHLYRITNSLSSGMSRSLESVLGGGGPRAQNVGMVRVDQHGKLMPPAMTAQSVVTPQDPRRFSEASIIPPPRPPPPNLKHLKPQRRPTVQRLPHGTSWPPPGVLSPPPQQPPPQPFMGGSNLTKMAHMARSTPQLDECDSKERERPRDRDRDKSSHIYSTKDSLISQVYGGYCHFILFV